MKVRCLLPLALSVLAACGGSAPLLPTAPSFTGPEAARSYLNELVDIMQANSYKRQQIDWAALRASVLDAGSGATTIAATSPGILRALTLLADGHSRYVSVTGATIGFGTKTCRPSGAGQPALPADIGYVKVTGFSGTGAAITAFADSIQAQIRAADRDDLAGWIVDLRGNGGGNMWPMIAGLGPLLGDGIVGNFIYPDGLTIKWSIIGSTSRVGSSFAAGTSSSYTMRRPSPRVAVLVDNAVASSGEATMIAFRGRENTRSFGVATCGLTSSVATYQMSDSASLLLADSLMADRNRVAFGDQLQPDEVVEDVVSAVVSRAIAWLRNN
jgi:carboxyl-terminal processing protease